MKVKLKNIAQGFGKLLLSPFIELDAETRETAQKRLELCQRCEHRTTINTCKLCSCVLAAKALASDEKCPKGLW